MIKSVLFFIVGIIVLALIARIHSSFLSYKKKITGNLICEKCKKVKSPYKGCSCNT